MYVIICRQRPFRRKMIAKAAYPKEEVKAITAMESHLKNAINDLIEESEDKSKLVTQHVSMIITHLAKAAADLRIKKQEELEKL